MTAFAAPLIMGYSSHSRRELSGKNCMKCVVGPHHPCTKKLYINHRCWRRLILVFTVQACKPTSKSPYLRRKMSLFALTVPSIVYNIFSSQGDYCHCDNRLLQCNHKSLNTACVYKVLGRCPNQLRAVQHLNGFVLNT